MRSFLQKLSYSKLFQVARLETFPFKAPVDNIDESEEGEDESGEDEDQQLDLQEILMGQCKKGGEAVEVENKGKKEKKHEQEESKEEKIVQENGTNEGIVGIQMSGNINYLRQIGTIACRRKREGRKTSRR